MLKNGQMCGMIEAQINGDATETPIRFEWPHGRRNEMFACASYLLAARSCHTMASDAGWIKACAPARRDWNNRFALSIQQEPLPVERLEPRHVFKVERIR
jgi:hypothetical protein